MFNIFTKKGPDAHGFTNKEEYTPASLPKNVESGHADLSKFITTNYSLLDETYLSSIYKELEAHMLPLIQISDEFTVGETCDAYIKKQLPVIRSKHAEEVAMHELSGTNILNARQVRQKELENRIPKAEETIEGLKEQINLLKDKHAKHAVRIGDHIIQLGLPVTLIALMADFFVNKQFVQSILYSNIAMLMIMVICLCLMSDGTMCALGALISQKSTDTTRGLYRIFFTLFVSLFVISVVGSMAIRLGSMDLTYGTYDAAGNFVGKESFTVAEYALAFTSSICPAVTGILTLYYSFDKDYYLEKECIKLRADLKKTEETYAQIKSEYEALQIAPDPMICDKERREAAEVILANLPTALEMHMRKLLAVHQQDASYADSMAVSAHKLLGDTDDKRIIGTEHTHIEELIGTEDSGDVITTLLVEKNELKEAV